MQYAEIHRKGDSITQAMQHNMIGKNIYGNPSDPYCIGLAEQWLKRETKQIKQVNL